MKIIIVDNSPIQIFLYVIFMLKLFIMMFRTSSLQPVHKKMSSNIKKNQYLQIIQLADRILYVTRKYFRKLDMGWVLWALRKFFEYVLKTRP